MIRALEMINNPSNYLKELWLKYLLQTKEINYNVGHVKSMSLLNNKCVFNYVKRTFEILDGLNISNSKVLFYVTEALKWSEVAKCGLKYEREEWQKKGFNLKVHNEGSADIYKDCNADYDEVVYYLIKTHGLLGQCIQGEINLSLNKELYILIEKSLIDKTTLEETIKALNYCIINGVKEGLYESVQERLEEKIKLITSNCIPHENFYSIDYLVNRFKVLRKNNYIDNYDELRTIFNDKNISSIIGDIFRNLELWYFEVALSDFNLLEIIKIFLIVNIQIKDINKYRHLTFESIMKMMYIEYDNKRVINIYKKRIIETYLKSLTLEDLINKKLEFSKHISAIINIHSDTLEFNFDFSIQATKLIEFCEVSYGSDEIYDKAIFLLYDLFGFRRDAYDRFYNEERYLKTMNASLSHKAKILDYIEGTSVLDIGPGGGALMDLIEETIPDVEVCGIDISQNVIDELTKRKNAENRKWNLIKGDALYLENYLKDYYIDTIIYSSIIHELYSYIETDGKKFNKETILKAMKSAYNILPLGGRIIIRDGIMTEPKDTYRIIEFKNVEDIRILDNYCNDFEGRTVSYETVDENKVRMMINDAMEFLYTYTWGPNSYALEVKEQFGYFTPTEYINFFKENFDQMLEVIACRHFLQDGYDEYLLKKISIYDDEGNVVTLPDSTCIIVVKKIG